MELDDLLCIMAASLLGPQHSQQALNSLEVTEEQIRGALRTAQRVWDMHLVVEQERRARGD